MFKNESAQHCSLCKGKGFVIRKASYTAHSRLRKAKPEICVCERGEELKAMLNGYYMKKPGAWE